MKSKQRNIIIFAVLLLILLYYRRQAAAAANQAGAAIRKAVSPSPERTPGFVPGGFGTPEQVAAAADQQLARGSEGSYVSALQTWLNGQGAGLNVDGKFGPKTEGALISIFGKRTINISDFIEGPFLG